MSNQELQSLITQEKKYRSSQSFISWEQKTNKYWIEAKPRKVYSENGTEFSIKMQQRKDSSAFSINLFLNPDCIFLSRLDFHVEHPDIYFYTDRVISKAHVHLPCPSKVEGKRPDCFSISCDNKFSNFSECFNYMIRLYNIQGVPPLQLQGNLFQ